MERRGVTGRLEIRGKAAMSETSPTAILKQDHVVAFTTVDALAQDLAYPEDVFWAKTAEGIHGRVAALRDALLVHFRREEEALFPEVVDLVSEDAPEADIIAGFFHQESDDDLSAHTTLRLALHGIANLLERMTAPNARPQHSITALRDRFARARDLLSRHVEKEETVIFPMIERLLEEEQLRAIAVRLAAITSAI